MTGKEKRKIRREQRKTARANKRAERKKRKLQKKEKRLYRTKGKKYDTNHSIGTRILDLFKRDGELGIFYEELEDLLIQSDIGGTASKEIVDALKDRASDNKLSSTESLKTELKDLVSGYLTSEKMIPDNEKLNIFLVLGVNGVGKTTTIAKMARYFKKNGNDNIVFSAADTFRAGAIDQLKLQGERTGSRVVAQNPGADPGAVIYDTIQSAQKRDEKIILADTAGRMHTKKHLIKELEKIDKIIKNRAPDANYKKILVIDATTGQNGLHQAEIFHEAMKLDGVILTKYDSSSKGGILVSISRKLKLPFLFIGKGEGLDDFSLFEIDDYLDELLG